MSRRILRRFGLYRNVESGFGEHSRASPGPHAGGDGIAAAFAVRMAMTVANCVLIDRTIDFVLQHYAEPITVRGLARTLGRPPRELERLFRRRFSLTVSDYITRVKLEHADELLCDGLSIPVVALKVGYKKTATFCARFKRYFGSTPTPSGQRIETRRRVTTMLPQAPATPERRRPRRPRR